MLEKEQEMQCIERITIMTMGLSYKDVQWKTFNCTI